MPHTTIAIACHAGGVGKTTTTRYLAEGLAYGHALAIDLDPQHSLSRSLGLNGEGYHTEDLLTGRCSITNAVATIDDGENAWQAIPSSLRLQETAAWLQLQPVTHDHLAQALRPLHYIGVPDSVPYVTLLDCPPAADLLTINALVAADYVIVPVIPEPKGLDGLQRMTDLVAWVNTRGISKAQLLGCVITQIDWRTKMHQEHVDQLRTGPVPVLAEITMAKGMDQDQRLRQMYEVLVDEVAAALATQSNAVPDPAAI